MLSIPKNPYEMLPLIIGEEDNCISIYGCSSYRNSPSHSPGTLDLLVMPFVIVVMILLVTVVNRFLQNFLPEKLLILVMLSTLVLIIASSLMNLIISVFFMFIQFAVCWYFLGKGPQVDYTAVYEREPPSDYSPSIVKFLLSGIKVPFLREIAAEILYLELKGKFKIHKIVEDGKDEFLVEIVNYDTSDLTESQKTVFDLIRRVAKSDPQSFWEKYIIRKPKSDSPSIATMRDFGLYLNEYK